MQAQRTTSRRTRTQAARHADSPGVERRRLTQARLSGAAQERQRLWLGHEQERTAHIYLHADLAIKQRALDRVTPPNGRPGRYRPPARIPRRPLT
jgi:hypothetical protein